jgi:hypothetical protein
MQPDVLDHAAQQADFHRALWQTDHIPAGLTAPDATELALRFAVYRNNVQHGLARALEARFPVIAKLVGHDFFREMARLFANRHPPEGPVLLHWGGALPRFLTEFPPVAHLPYLADVARLELLRGQAYHAADATALRPDALNDADLPNLRLHLHPSVHLFTSPWPAVQIWLSQQLGAAKTKLTSGPDHALIARHPDFAVMLEPVDIATYSVLAALQAGQTLGQAAQVADPTAALTLLLRHGLIIDPQTGAPDVQHP